jgi:DNA-binding NtrC family response regulator
VPEELGPTLQEEPVSQIGPERLLLVLITQDGASSIPLPENGTITIGRSAENTIKLDDPLISRTHAAIHVGNILEVEDLASANGTRFLGRELLANVRQRIEVGQVVDLGSSMIVVQRTTSLNAPSKKLVSHAHLEIRLEEECARSASGTRAPFSLIRLHVENISRRKLELIFSENLRAQDVVASYGPRDLEVLLLDSVRSRTERVARELVSAMETAGGSAEVAIASYPADGISADALISCASAALRKEAGTMDVVVADAAMQDLYRVIERVAQGSISVLFLGETGVGKEVVASALHRSSPRRSAPLLRLNCAALSETLVDSELFGHEKGAFTGADRAKVGLLEAANGGTIFLDEVGELPLPTQAKLLRALEQREVLRVGALTARKIDVRFVSATNRDLEQEIARGKFRRDLYYRLNGVTLRVPPLRERKREIEPLARSFAERVSAEMGRPVPSLSASALDLLRSYSWPGNIRELKNAVERAVLLAEDDTIDPVHLPIEKLLTSWPKDQEETLAELDDEARADRARIVEALEQCAGNQTRASEILGISRQTLSKRLALYDIPRPRK